MNRMKLSVRAYDKYKELHAEVDSIKYASGFMDNLECEELAEHLVEIANELVCNGYPDDDRWERVSAQDVVCSDRVCRRSRRPGV